MEKKSRSMVWKALLAVAMVSVVGIGTALVQENKDSEGQYTRNVECTWTRPTTGTQVHHYVVQVEFNNVIGDSLFSTPTESIILSFDDGDRYRYRVAGVDASGAQGPMSDWSRIYEVVLDDPPHVPSP